MFFFTNRGNELSDIKEEEMVQFKGTEKTNIRNDDVSTFENNRDQFSSSLEMENDVSSELNATDERKLNEKFETEKAIK